MNNQIYIERALARLNNRLSIKESNSEAKATYAFIAVVAILLVAVAFPKGVIVW